MRPLYYILGGANGHEAVECDLLSWSVWFDSSSHHVAHTVIGRVAVSTIFLGIDRGFEGPPILFETMIFGGANDHYQERYSTWREAAAGHARLVETERLPPPDDAVTQTDASHAASLIPALRRSTRGSRKTIAPPKARPDKES